MPAIVKTTTTQHCRKNHDQDIPKRQSFRKHEKEPARVLEDTEVAITRLFTTIDAILSLTAYILDSYVQFCKQKVEDSAMQTEVTYSQGLGIELPRSNKRRAR